MVMKHLRPGMWMCTCCGWLGFATSSCPPCPWSYSTPLSSGPLKNTLRSWWQSWWWYWWWCLRKDTKDVKDVDHHKTFITAFAAPWHDGQEYGTKRDNTTSKRGSWIILFGPPPHKMFAPVSVYTLFISYISFTTAENKNLAAYKQMIRFLRKRKVFLLLNESLFAKYDI